MNRPRFAYPLPRFAQPLMQRVTPVPAPARLLLAALLVMSVGVMVPVPLARAVLVLPAALLVPGYALLAAAFGATKRRDVVPDLALSALLSMALYALLSIGLYAAAIRLSTASVLSGIDVISAVLIAYAVWRTTRTTWQAPAPLVMATAWARSPWVGARAGLLFGAIVGVVIVALAVAMRLLPTPAAPPYSQFYLAGAWSRLGTTVSVRPHTPLAVHVGISNQTHEPHVYRIDATVDQGVQGVQGVRWAQRHVAIAAGHTWTGTMSGYVPASGCIHRISITVRLSGRRTVFRSIDLWAQSTAPPRPCHSH